MNILLTGGSGFLGRHLQSTLRNQQLTIMNRKKIGTYRQINLSMESLLEGESFGEEFEVVIHLAGLAHKTSISRKEFIKINADATIALAEQALNAGMKRFIFLSSIGVLGNSSKTNSLNEVTPESPHSDYAYSKYVAENRLKELAKNKGFELVIIRPPLIYGDSAPGNFSKLLELVSKNIPMPFGLVNNQRSYISVLNLCEFIKLTITHPKAADHTFVIDDIKLSTKELIEMLAQVKNKKVLQLPIPSWLLKLLLKLVGRSGMSTQLLDNLVIDCTKAEVLLNWSPEYSFYESFNISEL